MRSSSYWKRRTNAEMKKISDRNYPTCPPSMFYNSHFHERINLPPKILLTMKFTANMHGILNSLNLFILPQMARPLNWWIEGQLKGLMQWLSQRHQEVRACTFTFDFLYQDPILLISYDQQWRMYIYISFPKTTNNQTSTIVNAKK